AAAGPAPSPLADLVQEALEVKGQEADQHLRLVGFPDEDVRESLGAKRERAGREGEALLADVDSELPFEHVEPLVLIGVDVPGEPSPARTVTSSSPNAPPVSAPLILTTSSVPSSHSAHARPLRPGRIHG